MKPTDPFTICAADQAKLIAVYMRLCPDDVIFEDDPRRTTIAAEVLDVGKAPSVEEALRVIEWWNQPKEWAREFVVSVRRSVARMSLQGTV